MFRQRLARNLAAPETDTPPDRRFKNPLWQTNPFYSFVMKQYQINADALRRAADSASLAKAGHAAVVALTAWPVPAPASAPSAAAATSRPIAGIPMNIWTATRAGRCPTA